MTRYLVIDPAEPGKQVARLAECPDGTAHLFWLQEQVGGYIEHVTLQAGALGMYVNDEGLLKDLPWNPIASVMYDRSQGGNTGALIHGPVVFVGEADQEGNDTDVPPEMITMLVASGCTVVGP